MKVSEEILSLVPYVPGKPISEAQREYGVPHVVKLASNENPLGPSPKVLAAMQNALKDLHRYPDPSCFELIGTLNKTWKIPLEQLAIANGSNEAIDLLIRIFCEPGDSILTCESAFVAYQVCAQAARVKRIFVPLSPGLKMDLKEMSRVYRQQKLSQKIKIIFIPNPNNPTGTYVNKTEIETFLSEMGKDKDCLVVFDEAYHEFVRAKDYETGLSWMERFPQIVVLRTLSKAYGLAGARVGVLVANPRVIDLYNRVRNPFNVNHLAQVAAVAALQDSEYIKESVEITHKGLDYFYQELVKMGLSFIESQANFVLFDTKKDAKLVSESLLRKGVILRPVLNYGYKTHLRMSVGTKLENEKAIFELKNILKP